ncbi:MAG TPA: T9SS type A sorting domain-containing protein [Bacteroidia bacterium]|nr:T9SS type A sorting domain-containing protein [Bacteroidia bacterium]
MKHLHFLRIAAVALPLALPALVNGQDFLNGSFEKNGNLCLINTSPTVFNANVKNTKSFGSFRQPDIASSNCGFGSAKDGNWFVGLATNVQGDVRSEAITMELSSPVAKGGQYTLDFWARLRSFAPNLQLGVSNADSSCGTVFYTVSSKSIGNDWTEISVRFTAPVSGKYISVRAVNANENSGVWVDAFRLSNVFIADNVIMTVKPADASKAPDNVKTASVAAAKKTDDNQVGLYPNPSDGIIKVSADSAQLVSLTVYNMLGSQVEQHIATPDQPIPDKIDLTDQQPGLYFVEMATIDGSKFTKRIIISR